MGKAETRRAERDLARGHLVEKILNEYVPNPAVPLKHHSLYTLLVAVLLSARCTDLKVNQVTPPLFALADTPQKMALQSIESVRKIIRPCGLSQRKAESIVLLSQMLVQEYGGEVPSALEHLTRLPGIGHKSASVVLVQGFQVPAFPVDTHIFRCARRWGLSAAKTVVGVEADLKALFSKDKWGLVHLQIIYFARKFCPAKKHFSINCPICRRL